MRRRHPQASDYSMVIGGLYASESRATTVSWAGDGMIIPICTEREPPPEDAYTLRTQIDPDDYVTVLTLPQGKVDHLVMHSVEQRDAFRRRA